MNLSNVFLVQLPNFSLSFSLLFQWLQFLLVQSYISGSTFVVSLHINSCILTPFRFLLHNISVCGYCHIYQCACFLFFVFNYYIWPICCNFSVCVYCLTSPSSYTGLGMCVYIPLLLLLLLLLVLLLFNRNCINL